jgi:cytosine/adenosine deaminase-related metal-dependent hydrolase
MSNNTNGSFKSTTAPREAGAREHRLLIKGGVVLTMDPGQGDFNAADVLIEGSRILAVGPNLPVRQAEVIDAAGMIVMPGFVDTHHHLSQTALRGFLADGLLSNDGHAHGEVNYYDYVLLKLGAVYRPEDVYISELVGSLSQLDVGVTTVMDVSQIHHTPEHSDAAVTALRHAARRSVLGYFEGLADRTRYPADAHRLKLQHFSSNDQLLTMAMGGEIYLPGHETAWTIGRELGVPIALHVVGAFGMRGTFEELARASRFGPDNIFVHVTGMSDLCWRAVADAGSSISLSVPVEMSMRHGMPPILKALEHGIQPSLSTDVECTMAADLFTQMRAAFTLQRALVNEAVLAGANDAPELLTSRDVLRFATLEGAKCLHLDRKIGTIAAGKQADIIMLDATALNVVPLNHAAGAVVTLMDRSNVDTVIVGGKIRKWRGSLLDVDLPKLRSELEASRNYLFETAGVARDLFRQ